MIDEESLVFTPEGRKDISSEFNIVIENSNAASTSFNYRRRKCSSEKWTAEETDRFYKALQQYGTDFSLIALLFPTRTRSQVRNKFKKEEKDHPKRVDKALTQRRPIEKDEFELLLARAQEKAREEKEQAENSEATKT